MRRVIALMLTIAMVASLATGLAITGFAAVNDTFVYGGLKYKVLSETDAIKTVEVIASGTDYAGNITIPATATDSNSGNSYTVTSIGKDAFKQCKQLTGITIQNGVTTIGSGAFQETGLTKVEISDSVTTFGDSVFKSCISLTDIKLPNNIEAIGSNAFNGCKSLKNIKIPDNVTSIDTYAFAQTGLTSIEIPVSVTNIGLGAFGACSGLTSIEIPNSVTSIGNNVFYGCTSLTDVTVKATNPPTLGTNAFANCSSLSKIYVPTESLNKYVTSWTNYRSNIKVVTESDIKINDKPIENCFDAYGATSITISSDLKTVTVDKITTNTDTNIYIPSGKTLVVSTTDNNTIFTTGKINVTGGGKLVAYCGKSDKSAIFANGGLEIEGVTVEATLTGNQWHGFGAENGGVIISNSNLTVNSAGSNGIVALESGDVKIYNSNVTATNLNGTAIKAAGSINITNNSSVSAKGGTAAYAVSGSIIVKGVTITDQNYTKYFNGATGFDGTKITGTDYVTVKYPKLIDSGILINNTTITNFNYSSLGVTGFDYDSATNTLTVEKISTSGDLTINIPQGKTLKVSTTNTSANEDAIASNGVINIKGKGRLVINAVKDGINTANHGGNEINIAETTINITTNSVGINSNNKINITSNSNITVDSGGCGLEAVTSVNIASGCVVKARTDDQFGAFYAGISILIDGQPITQANIKNGTLSNTDAYIFIIANSSEYATVPYVEPNPGPTPPPDPLPAEEEEQADPEVDIDFDFGTVTIKTSNKSIVLDDKRIVEKIIGETEEDYISFDLTKVYIANTKSTKDFDGLFLNNEAYRYLGEAGKDIEIVNRFAYAIVYTGKEVGNNPLSLHLTDVSKEAGLCATAIQKKAMQTSNIYAEVNYSFVTNGKPTDNEAKIYVPVPAEAKVFYLFNENKIGTVPCEVIDGYCVFDRYYDGTYVVCEAK